ncbi:MAG: glycosyltransferase family 4 protein [Rhodospirillales bacterium]
MAAVLMAAYTNYRRDPRVRREAEALVEAGHDVVFLACRRPGEPDREILAGVTVKKLAGLQRRCTSFTDYLIDYAIFGCMLSLHLLRHPLRYRLIHINNMPDFLVFAAWLPRLLGRPVIHDIHDLMPELYVEKFASGERHWLVRALELQERWAGRFATAVLTVEERLRDILSGRGIPREKIHVLMNLPDERIFRQRPSSPRKPADAPFVLVYHGTLAHRLGLDLAIEAVAKARAAIPRMQLRIIGAGEERSRLMELRDRLGLADVVQFSDGFVPVEAIPPLIEDADIGLVPLRVSSGTDIMLPTKLLEYVFVGIPCVVPRTNTITRYFDDDMVAFFAEGNATSLSETIVRLYRCPEEREALAQAATERFSRTYRWSAHKAIYVGLVSGLLGGEGSGRRVGQPSG